MEQAEVRLEPSHVTGIGFLLCCLTAGVKNHRMVGVGRDLCGSSSPTQEANII